MKIASDINIKNPPTILSVIVAYKERKMKVVYHKI